MEMTLNIKKKRIIGLIGKNRYAKHQMLLNNTLVDIKNTIYVDCEPTFFTNNVSEEINLSINNTDILKVINDNFSIHGKIDKLSISSQKILQIIISLYSGNIVILNEPFVFLDYDNKKKLITIMKDIKRKLNKTIIIISNNINMIYELCDDIVLCCEKYVYSESIFTTKEFIDSKEALPILVSFTNKAREKNVNLSYHRDIRDLIKDVYRNV